MNERDDDGQPWFQLSPFLTHPFSLSLIALVAIFTFCSAAVSQFKSNPSSCQAVLDTSCPASWNRYIWGRYIREPTYDPVFALTEIVVQIWKNRLLVKIELCQYVPGVGYETLGCIIKHTLIRSHKSKYVVAAVFNSRPLPACPLTCRWAAVQRSWMSCRAHWLGRRVPPVFRFIYMTSQLFTVSQPHWRVQVFKSSSKPNESIFHKILYSFCCCCLTT